jgi:hypothetical protein
MYRNIAFFLAGQKVRNVTFYGPPKKMRYYGTINLPTIESYRAAELFSALKTHKLLWGITWILSCWEELDSALVKGSYAHCALNATEYVDFEFNHLFHYYNKMNK